MEVSRQQEEEEIVEEVLEAEEDPVELVQEDVVKFKFLHTVFLVCH